MRGLAGRAGVLLLLIAPLSGSLHADDVTLASSGTPVNSGQYNSDGATIAITPSSAWAAAIAGSSWVSFEPTGDSAAPGYVVVPNGSVVDFFDTFTVAGIATGGTLTVMADDSAAVLLNGVLLMSEATPVGNSYSTCSDFGIGCLQPTTLDLPASLLATGSNTLEFEVAQRAGWSFGLDYQGTVTDPLSMPEPGSGISLALGLLLLSLLSFLLNRKLGLSAAS